MRLSTPGPIFRPIIILLLTLPLMVQSAAVLVGAGAFKKAPPRFQTEKKRSPIPIVTDPVKFHP